MMKAVVVDDESLISEHICRLLGKAGVEVLDYYSNPYEALEKVELLKPDVLFLDIEMPEMTGLELAEKIHARGCDCEIVFITAYNQYAIEAFSVNALDYLLKPVTSEGLHRAVERVMTRRRRLPSDLDKNTRNKIRISLFGRLCVYNDDEQEPIHWMTAKCAEVFAFMLLQKGEREVSKWKLIEAIWPDKDMEKADINLRSTISRLNKTLRENATGISMISTGNGYQLSSKDRDLEVDAFKLEKLVLNSVEVSFANVDYYDSVILSYGDMLLEDLSSEWCDALKVNYHRYFISAAKKLVKYYERVNTEPLKILNIIELIIKYEPYDEEIRETALKMNYQLGGKQGVEKYYQEYRYLLERDLGIEPSEFMQGVYGTLIK